MLLVWGCIWISIWNLNIKKNILKIKKSNSKLISIWICRIWAASLNKALEETRDLWENPYRQQKTTKTPYREEPKLSIEYRTLEGWYMPNSFLNLLFYYIRHKHSLCNSSECSCIFNLVVTALGTLHWGWNARIETPQYWFCSEHNNSFYFRFWVLSSQVS